MKKALLLCTILIFSVISAACVNNLAVQELNNKAAEFLDKGDAASAVCRLKASLDLDDEVYQTHYNLAAAYNALGSFDEAVKEAYRALELKPDLYDAYFIAAAAREAQAYKILDEAAVNDEIQNEAAAEAFNVKAKQAIEEYNKYLENSPEAKEKDKINDKIAELNNKINQNLNISAPQEETP